MFESTHLLFQVASMTLLVLVSGYFDFTLLENIKNIYFTGFNSREKWWKIIVVEKLNHAKSVSIVG